MATRKKPSTIAEAKKAKSKTFYGKGNKELAAVTKEELEKSGLSLRDYLNKQQGKTKRTAAKVAPRPKPRPSKRSTDTGQRPDNRPVKPKAKAPAPKRKIPAISKASPGADLSAPELKSSPRGSSAPINITGGTVPSRGTGKTNPYKYVGKGPRGKQGQAPIPTTEEKIGMASLVLGGLGGPGAKLATKAATTYGKPFVNKLVSRIKNLSNKQQEDIMKEIARSNLSKKDMNIALKNAETPKDIRTQIALRKAQASAPGKRAPGEKPFKQTTVRKRQEARNRQRRQETQKKQELERMNVQGAGSTRIPSARLRKKGGPIVARKGSGSLKSVDTQQNPGLAKLPTNVRNRMGYAKSGGKVVNRKSGGMIGSGNDLVASIYD